MKHCLSVFSFLCLLAAALPVHSKGTREERSIRLWGLPSSYGGGDIPEEALVQANV